jgi:hypothetical protein
VGLIILHIFDVKEKINQSITHAEVELEIFGRDFITKNKRNKTKDYSSQGKIYYFLGSHYEKIKIRPKL